MKWMAFKVSVVLWKWRYIETEEEDVYYVVTQDFWLCSRV